MGSTAPVSARSGTFLAFGAVVPICNDYISALVKRQLVVDLYVFVLYGLSMLNPKLWPCVRCRKPGMATHHSMCEECKPLARKENRAVREARKEQFNECRRCMRPCVPGLGTCETHRDMAVEASRERYRRLRKTPKRIYRCARCGEAGHTAKTCSKPKPAWCF